MRTIWVIALLSGCAAQQENPELLDVARPTREQILEEQKEDIQRAREAGEWQAYVCAQAEDVRARLIQQTQDEQGWRIICPRRPAMQPQPPG